MSRNCSILRPPRGPWHGDDDEDGRQGGQNDRCHHEVPARLGIGNRCHEQGLKDLFRRHGASNAMAYLIGSEIYGELEKVVDRFEDVANEISGIVIENV